MTTNWRTIIRSFDVKVVDPWITDAFRALDPENVIRDAVWKSSYTSLHRIPRVLPDIVQRINRRLRDDRVAIFTAQGSNFLSAKHWVPSNIDAMQLVDFSEAWDVAKNVIEHGLVYMVRKIYETCFYRERGQRVFNEAKALKVVNSFRKAARHWIMAYYGAFPQPPPGAELVPVVEPEESGPSTAPA